MTQTKTYLLQALEAAKKGRGQCAPNPAVGAAVVKNGQLLAMGFHRGVGCLHAEAEALSQLSDEQCKDAEIFVTLEPCSHFGRTPPCADLLIAKKIKTVYFSLFDPNPLVQGKGRDKLIAAGIECKHCPLPEIEEFYRSYVYWHKMQQPFVTAKIALSLDGKIANRQAEVKLTGQEADLYTHQQRYQTDGILSTAATVISDDPQFNARLPEGKYAKKLFILDSTLNLPLEAKIFKTAQSVTIFHAETVNKNRTALFKKAKGLSNIYFVPCPVDLILKNTLDLNWVVKFLGKEGLQDLWVEAGGQLLNNLLGLKLVNRLIVYICPQILGQTAVPGFWEAQNLPKPSWQPLGSDIMGQFEF